MDEDKPNQHAYLWTTRKSDFRLVRNDSTEEPLIVDISQPDPQALLISDDEVRAAVKRRMLDEGVPIVTWAEVRRKKNVPGSSSMPCE